MNEPNDTVTLGSAEQAERLWQGAIAAFERSDGDLAELSESLDLGLRAVEILAFRRLQPVRDRFPATIGALLDSPPPEVDLYRDAVELPRSLRFADVLDLLSEESLDCVGPDLHRGWEDRRFSCRRSRATAREAIGFALADEERRALLTLAAYRNRIFRLPPPVRLVPSEIRSAFGALVSLVERLER